MRKINFDMNDAIAEKIGDWKNPSAYSREAAENWMYICRYATKKFTNFFTEAELGFLKDLFNGHIFSNDIEKKITFDMMVDDSHLDHLPEKWEVDIEAIKSKIDNDLDAYILSFLLSDSKI